MIPLPVLVANIVATIALFSLLRWLGVRIRRYLTRSDSPSDLIFDIPLGALPVIFIMALAQTFGFYRPFVAYLLLGLGVVALGESKLRRDARTLFKWVRSFSPLELLLFGTVMFAVALAMIAGLAPPIAKDALVYHLTVQKLYIERGGFFPIPGFIYSYFPQGGESLFAIGLLVGCDRLPAMVHAVFGLCAIGTAYRFARLIGSARVYGLLASAGLAVTPSFWFEMASPYVDVTLAAFSACAFLGLLMWHTEKKEGWLWVAGLMIGGALSVKYLAIVAVLVLLIFFLGLLFKAQKTADASTVAFQLFILLGNALVVPSVFFLRNVWVTRNPVFPFLWDLFPTKADGWDAERTFITVKALNFLDLSSSPLGVIALPFQVCFFGEHEVIKAFEGEIGPLHILFLFSFLAWKYWSFETRVCSIGIVLFFLYWAFNAPQLRYLFPILPLSVAVSAFSLEQAIRLGRRASITPILIVLVSVLWLFGAWRTVRLAVSVGPFDWMVARKSPDSLLRDRLEVYPFLEWLNRETPPGTRVWLVDTGARTYYLERPFITDYVVEDHTLAKMVRESKDVDELAGKVAELKAQYLLIAPVFLFDERTTPFDTDAEKERLRQFLKTRCRLVQSGERLILFRLPE